MRKQPTLVWVLPVRQQLRHAPAASSRNCIMDFEIDVELLTVRSLHRGNWARTTYLLCLPHSVPHKLISDPTLL